MARASTLRPSTFILPHIPLPTTTTTLRCHTSRHTMYHTTGHMTVDTTNPPTTYQDVQFPTQLQFPAVAAPTPVLDPPPSTASVRCSKITALYRTGGKPPWNHQTGTGPPHVPPVPIPRPLRPHPPAPSTFTSSYTSSPTAQQIPPPYLSMPATATPDRSVVGDTYNNEIEYDVA